MVTIEKGETDVCASEADFTTRVIQLYCKTDQLFIIQMVKFRAIIVMKSYELGWQFTDYFKRDAKSFILSKISYDFYNNK